MALALHELIALTRAAELDSAQRGLERIVVSKPRSAPPVILRDCAEGIAPVQSNYLKTVRDAPEGK